MGDDEGHEVMVRIVWDVVEVDGVWHRRSRQYVDEVLVSEIIGRELYDLGASTPPLP
jgi:hypothetical protein